MTHVKTTCPYCGVGCGVQAAKQSDNTYTISGDVEHPANRGKLCSKGSDLANTLSPDNRLLHPLVNNKTSSWESALTTVSDALKKTLEDYGPESVAFYVSGQLLTEDYYVVNKFVKGYLGTANIDTNSRLCMASSVAGYKRSLGSDTVPGCYADLDTAKLVVLVGTNLAWCHPILFQRLCESRDNQPAMKIVVIDPRRTATAEMADTHYPIIPGSDSILFGGLLKYLNESGSIDNDYIEAFTQQFDASIESSTHCTVDFVSKNTGLSTQEIYAFYELFADTKETVTLYSQGINQSENGTDSVSSIINCHLATGRIGLPGMGPFSITGQPNAMGGREVGGLSNMLAAHMDIENPIHRERVQRFWGSPRIAQKPGLKAVDLFNAVAANKIRFIWIMATNPVDSMPLANTVGQALKNCPFVVVSDVASNTDTQEFADVRLPSAAWSEKNGTVTNSERCISRQRAFRRSTGEVRPDWWQVSKVAQQLGFVEAFNYQDAYEIFREHAALSGFENDGTRDFDISRYQSIQAKQYDELSPFRWPARPDMHEETVRFFAKGEFYTESKRANFIPVIAQKITRTDEQYPLILNTGRIRDQWHTMTRTGFSAKLNAHLAEPFVEIHPHDANQNKISDADLVSVNSANGCVTVRALVTEKQREGSVFMPIHWTNQFASNARVDQLVSPRTDPVSGQPALKSEPVSISRVSPTTYGFALSQHAINFNQETVYWSKSTCTDGYRYEFASSRDQHAELQSWADYWHTNSNAELVDLVDENQGIRKVAFFDNSELLGVVYLANKPVLASRAWMNNLLSQSHSKEQRYCVLAGSSASNTTDIGAIVCSCQMIGINEINSAIDQHGCTSIAEIGKSTTAGTNCGSCRGEIKALLRTASQRHGQPA